MYQKLVIVGRLGRDPEQRFTPTGQAVTTFPVAVDDGKDKEGNKLTSWFRVTAFDKLAENCNSYLVKGKLVLVEGRVKVNAWADKATGEIKSSCEVTAHAVKFLSGGEKQEVEEF